MQNKIWLISEYYYPMYHSTGYYLTEIAEQLAKSRNNVNVICTNAGYNSDIISSRDKYEIRNNVNIYRVLIGNIDKNNFASRAVRLLFSSLNLFYKIFRNVKRGDEVLVVTNPAFLLLAMPVIKKLKGVGYKILVHDIFPENLVAIGRVNAHSVVAIWLKKWFDYAYSQADICIAIGRDMEKVIQSKTGQFDKTVLITNWSETQQVKPAERDDTSIIKELGLTDKFVLQFAGNLGHSQGIRNLLDAIKLVSKREIHFLFIGAGAQEHLIKELMIEHRLDNVTLLGYRSRESQIDFLNACDVALVTLSAGMFGLGVPSKAYNIMAAGKPMLVIADYDSEISLCVKEHQIGWVIPPDEPELLAQRIEDIYRCHRNDLCGLSNPRMVAEQRYSKEIVLQKFDSLFSR
jgi:glycosyltransferase involved in cell wall biosynthesis